MSKAFDYRIIDLLYRVTTVGEVAKLWGLNPETVRRACMFNKLQAWQDESGRWLISLESVIEYFGACPGGESGRQN